MLFRILFQPRNIACIILVLFCIQYIPLESRAGVSYLKLGISAICPFLFIHYTPKISKAFLLCILYFFLVFFAANMHPETLRWSTIFYLCSFLITYITFYNLIVLENSFSFNYFIHLLQFVVLVFFATLLIQQIFIIVGIRTFPLINLVQVLNRGIGANSLSYEPSSSARVIAVAFLSLLRMYELKFGHKLSLIEIYQEAKWPMIGFLWCMLTMGSGTAFIALGILLFYFASWRKTCTICIVIMLFYVLIPYIDFDPVTRAYKTFNSFLTLDINTVKETDTSAAVRVVPMINTLISMDLSEWDTWFGHGVDYSANVGRFSENLMIGGIGEYGFISFIVLQILVFSCAIKRFFSIETVFWVALFGMTLGNIPYTWGVLMIFTCSRYFQEQYENGLLITDENLTNKKIYY